MSKLPTARATLLCHLAMSLLLVTQWASQAKAQQALELSVTATAAKPQPQSAFTGEKITATLGATAGAPSALDENDVIDGPTWNWSVDSIQSRASASDPWTDSSAAAVKITQADDSKADATFTCTCSAPAFYEITLLAEVEYTDNENHSWYGWDEVVIDLVAGTWQWSTPDPILFTPVPDQVSLRVLGDNIDPWTGQGTPTYETISTLCDPVVCNSSESGQPIWDAGIIGALGGIWTHASFDDVDNADSGTAQVARKLVWVPLGSPAVNTNFIWNVPVELDLSVSVNANCPDPTDYSGSIGSGSGTAQILVNPNPWPGSVTDVETFDVSKTNVGDGPWTWAFAVAYPLGGSIGINQPQPTDYSKSTGYKSFPYPVTGNGPSNSPVSVTCSLDAKSKNYWWSCAQGPQQAMAQAKIPNGSNGIDIHIDPVNPRGPSN